MIKPKTTFVRFDTENTLIKEALHKATQETLDLEAQFQEKLAHVSSTVCKLREKIDKQISVLPRDKDILLILVNEIQQVVEYKSRLESIKTKRQICSDAASWLSRNREGLVQYVVNKIFSQGSFIEQKNKKVINISLQELKQSFTQDINCYLSWIECSLALGLKPRNIENGVVSLNLSPEYYKQAFSIITNEKRNPEISGLSVDSANILASYINRCLIKRDIISDA